MFPIVLNLTRVPVLLVGQGELLAKRLQLLNEAGATNLFCHSCESRNPEDSIWHEIPQQVRDDSKVVMVAGLSRAQSEPIAHAARAAGKLVNVEDVNDLCDFYFTANVRRGDLLIAISTNGASPTLARKIRDRIAAMFGPEWKERVAEIGAARQEWKKQGITFHGLIANAERFMEEKGWFDKDRAA